MTRMSIDDQVYEWEQPPVCKPPVQPSLAGRLLGGLRLVQHLQIGRTCPQENACSWRSDSCPTIMYPAAMNPGFLTASDALQFDTRLDGELAKLLLDDPHYRSFLHLNGAIRKPHPNDKIRIALVDLGKITMCQDPGVIVTSKKICAPGYAGWGSLEKMFAASTGKIGIVYAAYQMLSDLRERASIYPTTIRTKSDLLDKMNKDAWKSLVCKPDVNWLFTLDDTVNPVKVEMSASLTDYLKNMVSGGSSNVSTQLAFELILRIGFEYIASVLWQSGLYHPTRKGLRFHNTYEADTIDPRLINTPCQRKETYYDDRTINYVYWTTDPLGGPRIRGIYLNALSVATFFTLLAQRRLANPQLSQQMEALLRTGCWTIGSSIPSGASRLAVKCGVVSGINHNAALIINGGHCYVLVLLTRNAAGLDYDRLVTDLDRLVRSNP